MLLDDIERVVVSTQRQDSLLLDESSNVSVLNNADIKLINAVHINESLMRIPGVWISRGNGQEHLTAIRSPVLAGAGACGAFYMAEDGISLRAPGFCNANQLFGVNSEQASQIEVIRGPMSTLYGANALHGMVNVISPDATSLPELGLELEAGAHGYTRGKFSLSKQKNDHAFGIYGHATQDDGYKDDSGYGQQKLNLVHQFHSNEWQVKNLLSFTNLNQETAGFIEGFEAYKDPSLKESNPNPEAYRDSQSFRGYSQWRYQTQDNEYYQMTPYVRYHDMTFLMHFVPWRPVENNGHKSLGMQMQYYRKFNDIELISGLDWDFTQGWLSEVQEQGFAPHLPQGTHYDYEVDAANWSPFVNVSWQVSDELTIDAGIRYDDTEYDNNTLVPAGSACAPEVNNCRFIRPQDQSVSFSDWSVRLGSNYAVAQNHRIYAQYARGFRPPQATELFRLQSGQQVALLDSEYMQSFEVGVRGAAENWFYDVTWFDMSKKNHIFQDTQRQNIDNGETDHKGVELAVKWQFLPAWYASASATFAEHKYANDIQISFSGSILGNEIDTAPDKIANAVIGWRSEQGHSAELEWVLMGDYYVNPENTAQYAGHELVNLRAAWQVSEQWTLSARLLNLFDKDYAERADFGFGNYRYFVGEPRALYVSVGYQL